MKSNSSDAISKLLAAAEKAGGGTEKKSYGDEREWKPTVDKAGNGYAVLRFLPAAEGQDTPWVRYWDHGFKGPTGRWYIENSLTSIGKDDPVSEMNSQLWNSGRDEDKETARSRKRRLHYVSNVYVVSDPSNPENEGKVFLYKYGKKIFDKIMDVMQPQFQDEKPVNPFDFWGGADFKLKIRQVEGYRNYDKSEFAAPTEFLGADDAKLEAVYNTLHDLGEFVDPKNYKSYAELSKKLYEVLGETPVVTTTEAVSLDEVKEAPVVAPTAESVSEPTAEDDDAMSFFAKLAKED
tara:strand:- start:64 stop:942 length:879 start_codon:yes stop_codon:yes gene_type:complete